MSTNLFKKGLIENGVVGVINRRNARLFKKGLREKGVDDIAGVVKRRNACGTTLALKTANL